MNNNSCAVIGVGRVGLPLALHILKKGFHVIGIDVDKNLIEKLNNKEMPFLEQGCEEIMDSHDFKIYDNYSHISNIKYIIITVGTPLLQHIETELLYIYNVLDKILLHLTSDQVIILRSTVAPKTTEAVKKYIEFKSRFVIGHDIALSFCPERLVETRALEELNLLPQIIGVEDEKSAIEVSNFFNKICPEVIQTNYISAELSKLFCNTYRYNQCAISNQFAYIANDFNCNIFEILNIASHNYPRFNPLKPGFCSGTCLRKDFGMLNELTPYSDIFLSCWKINEYYPRYLVNMLKSYTNLLGKNIGILGYTFKGDCDDTRDSLVSKLIRYLKREVCNNILVHEPNILQTELLDKLYKNNTMDTVLSESDIIFICCDHSEFKDYDYSKYSNKIFVDCWNISEKNQLIYDSSVLEKKVIKKKILVTGGGGFIGFHLAKYLHKMDPDVEIHIYDNLSRGKMDEELSKFICSENIVFKKIDLSKSFQIYDKFEEVYHLAAVNGTKYFYSCPEKVLKVNILALMNLLDALNKENCSKFLFSSSSEAYSCTIKSFDNGDLIPTKENISLSVDDIFNPRYSYGGSKLIGEIITANYCKSKEIPFNIIRYHNVYGPRMGFEHVIPEFCMRIIKKEPVFKIFGGIETRAFIYIGDAVKMTSAVMKSNKCNNEIVHIGNPNEEIVIKDLAIKMLNMFGNNTNIEFHDAPQGSIKRRCPDISKLIELTGISPEIKLEEGLKEIFYWYKKNCI